MSVCSNCCLNKSCSLHGLLSGRGEHESLVNVCLASVSGTCSVWGLAAGRPGSSGTNTYINSREMGGEALRFVVFSPPVSCQVMPYCLTYIQGSPPSLLGLSGLPRPVVVGNSGWEELWFMSRIIRSETVSVKNLKIVREAPESAAQRGQTKQCRQGTAAKRFGPDPQMLFST